MDRGYLIFAINSTECQYTPLTYACLASLKITQPTGLNHVTVVTNDRAYFQDKKVSCNIVELDDLDGMDARSLAYDLSPYRETILLDADCLVLNSIDHYWDIFSNQSLFISTSPQTYEHKSYKYGPYREIFKKYNWPDVYSAFTYFKKDSQAKNFFETVKFITKNQEIIADQLLNTDNYKKIPTDEAFALALVLLDMEDCATHEFWPFPKITHMKSGVQNWGDQYVKNCSDKVNFHMDHELVVRVGRYRQTGIWHYVEKDFITDSLIHQLEQLLP